MQLISGAKTRPSRNIQYPPYHRIDELLYSPKLVHNTCNKASYDPHRGKVHAWSSTGREKNSNQNNRKNLKTGSACREA